MPEPLKSLYSEQLLSLLSQQILALYRNFDSRGFCRYVIDGTWEEKALKERMRHISDSLRVFLPQEYSDAVQILINASSKFRGFEYMFF
ncbi:MAG: hypothetical protein AAF329_26500, partial [Cyanobacteria bacterium P01_A01_bin.17]